MSGALPLVASICCIMGGLVSSPVPAKSILILLAGVTASCPISILGILRGLLVEASLLDIVPLCLAWGELGRLLEEVELPPLTSEA